MSTRATLAAALASVGVLAIGWQVGTASGQTVASGTSSNTTTTTTRPTGTTSAASSAGLKDGTFTGTTSSNRFGSVTVTATVSGGSITGVSARTQAGDNHSAQINSRAVPVLKSEVLAAQSAEVATVSGATYTSESYLTSLQSALDQAAA